MQSKVSKMEEDLDKKTCINNAFKSEKRSLEMKVARLKTKVSKMQDCDKGDFEK